MAYISQDEKKALAPAINAVLKKYGMRGTIGVRHGMTLTVTLQRGQLDLIGNWYDTKPREEKPTYLQLSGHWLESNFNGQPLLFLKELFDAMRGPDWFDHSDIQTDYFHVAHYVDVNVGKWNKPYKLEI